MAPPRKLLDAKQEKFIRMSARGCSRAEIMQEVFGVDLATAPANKINAKTVQMCRWRKLPEYETIWKDEIRNVVIASTSKAYRRLNAQIDDEQQPWLANKAANDILNHGKQMIFGADENTVTVHVAGMPEIGSPDQPEEDG